MLRPSYARHTRLILWCATITPVDLRLYVCTLAFAEDCRVHLSSRGGEGLVCFIARFIARESLLCMCWWRRRRSEDNSKQDDPIEQ
jgi:hypothetical protein